MPTLPPIVKEAIAGIAEKYIFKAWSWLRKKLRKKNRQEEGSNASKPKEVTSAEEGIRREEG